MHENVPIIIPTLLQERFALAYKHKRVVLFHAPCGSGKTVVVQKLLKQYKTCYMSVGDEGFSLGRVDDKCKVLVLDDLHLLESTSEKDALCELIRTSKNKQFVLLTRGCMPGFLMPFQFSGLLETFEMTDLLLDKVAIQLFANAYGLSPSYTTISKILNDSQGYAVLIAIIFRLLSEDAIYNTAIFNEGKRRLFLYFDEMVYNRLEKQLRRLLVKLAQFETFGVEMVVLLSGDKRAGEFLEKIQHDTSMLETKVQDQLTVRPIFREFLQWKFFQELDAEEQKDLFSRAGLYYELNGKLKLALDCYSKIGDHRKISDLLIKNAEQHVGIAQYLEMEQYYFSIPESEILRSPTLMAGMSLLCAMFSDFEKSDEWYMALKDTAIKLKKSDAEYSNAQNRIVYLDIALPQRGNKGLFGVITKVFMAMSDKKLRLPAVSITSSRPSILNGGKDFTAWTKQDTLVCATLRKPSELILGRDGVGLMDCVLCESFFEKNMDYQPKLLILISRLGEIQRKGSPDVEFAVVGLLARVQLSQGQVRNAVETIENLRIRFQEIGEARLLPNMEALLCRMRMQQGDFVFSSRWLEEKAPRDDLRIWALHRYQYLTKTMAFIANGEEARALLILTRLIPYVELCERTLDLIAIQLMSALCYFRMANKQWDEKLSEALDLCFEYHYVRTVAEYGAAILPLLIASCWKKDTTYLEEVIDATREQAVNYPLFLKKESRLEKPLTITERQVLKLLCHNMSNQEICDIMGIQLTTAKAHVSQILKKLGVSRRSEAKEVAQNLGLI